MRTPICEELGIEFPIFAFSHCRDVVAAVSRAGGLGVLGALAFTSDQLEEELCWIDEHVGGKPYGVDTVIPAEYVGKDAGDLSKIDLEGLIPKEVREFLDDLLARHGVPPLPEGIDKLEGLLGWSASGGRSHVDVALKHPIKLLANALGPPPADVVERAHEAGVKVAALIGNVKQALKQKEAGVDIIVASGYEAGGHTGEITTMVLVPQVVDAVAPTPVLAAGGIGSGRQMAAAMMLGAQGVWTGSIWLTVAESADFPVLKEKLLRATSNDTIRSRCLSGKPARQLKTPFVEAWEDPANPDPLPMPLQFLACAEAHQRIYRHAQSGADNAGDLIGTPVGQIVGMMNKQQPVKTLIYDMVNEYVECVEKAAAQLQQTTGP